MFEVQNKRNRLHYAVKKIDKSKLTVKEKEFLRDEIQIVSLLNHTHVVESKEIYNNPRWMWIVMEKVRGGELFSYL